MRSYSLHRLGFKNFLPAEVYNLMKFKLALLCLVHLPFNDMCNIEVMAKGGVVLDYIILRGVWVTAIRSAIAIANTMIDVIHIACQCF